MRSFVKNIPSPEKKEPLKGDPKNPKQLGAAFVEGARSDLKQKKEEAKNKIKEEMEARRKEDEELLKTLGKKARLFVIKPEYAYDERLKINREVNAPPDSLFMAIGFNQTPEDDIKHYRRFYPDELENIDDMVGDKPFNEFDILRGASRGNKAGLFSGMFGKPKTDDSGQISTIKKVGSFKGVVKVRNPDEKDDFLQRKKGKEDRVMQLLNQIHNKRFGKDIVVNVDDLETAEGKNEFLAMLHKMGCSHLKIVRFLVQTKYENMMSGLMQSETKCLARVYILEGFDFAQRDIGSASDPYVVVQCGKKKYNERENYQVDEPNPKIYKHFDFEVTFPGATPIAIHAYDYDDLFGDDIIGSTYIDLDDRFFSPEWNSVRNKPVEYR